MPPERGIEKELARRLHAELDEQSGPHPTWSDSRAASRVGRRTPAARPWVLVAVTLVLGSGLLGGLLLASGANQPVPSPSLALPRSTSPSPLGGPRTSSTADPVAALRRPLRVPAMPPDGTCPATPIGRTITFGTISYASGPLVSAVDELQGTGPLYVGGLDEWSLDGLPVQAGWYGNKFLAVIDKGENGPILMRAVRLDGNDPVGFGQDNAPELVVGSPVDRVFVEGIAFRAPGCYVIQLDGASTKSIVFRVEAKMTPAFALTSGDPSHALLARPFKVPAATGSCRVGPVTARTGFRNGLGDGPVFLVGDRAPMSLAGLSRQPNGTYSNKTFWVNTDPAERPFVVRGARIGGGAVQFEGGLVSGTSSFLYLAGDSGVSSAGVPQTWQEWPSDTAVPGPGCYVFQVDGASFSEQFTIQVVP